MSESLSDNGAFLPGSMSTRPSNIPPVASEAQGDSRVAGSGTSDTKEGEETKSKDKVANGVMRWAD